MSPVAVNHQMHLTETLEKMVFPSHDHERRRRNNHNNGENGLGDIPVDILETSKGYTFFLDVPGLSKSDIQVTVEEENTLVVRSNGKRKREDGEDEGCKYLRLERKASPKFLRKFRLPEDSNVSAIAARCENGVLTVAVEKLPPPEKKSKTVKVAVA